MTEQPPPPSYYEDEIDLRKYILVLFRRWWLIAGAAVLAAAAAFVVSMTMTPTYEASVDLATTKLKVEVQLGSQIQTITEEELVASGAQAGALVDRQARLEGYATLALNPGIAEEVLAQYAEQLSAIDEELIRPASFIKDHLESEVLTKTDVIRITVSLPDPQLAAQIANAWGEAYEERINRLYGGGSTQDLVAAQSQTAEAFKDYQTSQSKLEGYLADNPIPELQRGIDVHQVEIGRLQNALQESIALVSQQDLATRRSLLTGYYQDLIFLQRLLDDAKSLQGQLQAGPSSSAGAFGDALALIFMRSRAYSGAREEAGAPFALELQTPLSMEPGSVTAADVDGLVAVLEARLVETRTRIDDLTKGLLDPPGHKLPQGAGDDLRASMQKLTTEAQTLDAQLEAERAHKQDLTQQRDLAWDTYSTLARKETEVRVAAASGGTEVRLASPATPPANPTGPRKLYNTAIAGVVGGMLGVFGVFLLEFLHGDEEEGEEK
jgi:uncharacterized protein involved in exopolysaccharide biosynthesis